MKWKFDNSYKNLPASLYVAQNPVPVAKPQLIIINEDLLNELNLKEYNEQEDLAVLAGNALPAGAFPLAQAYAGHQYGYFTRLGDGRAILIGEHLTDDNKRYDIQLKGSGITPFSRNGDGRAAVGPMLREYIISEAMHALGIPTTRSLAVVSTGETIYRETPLAGAILTRVASSHIRVGTFEYAAQLADASVLTRLADYTITRHYPHLADRPDRYAEFLKEVCIRQASLLTKWLQVGFIHGVMNTDNMAISGETIDFGPCAFMNAYNPDTVFSSIDRYGRYAYRNQQPIGAWNLARFAETLLPLLSDNQQRAQEIAIDALDLFNERFIDYWIDGMRAKIGLFNRESADVELVNQLLYLMYKTGADFTNTFRMLSYEVLPQNSLTVDGEFGEWVSLWHQRAERQEDADARFQKMQRINAAVIPRNQIVESALRSAENGSIDEVQRLLDVLKSPFEISVDSARYQEPPGNEAIGYRTFCGT